MNGDEEEEPLLTTATRSYDVVSISELAEFLTTERILHNIITRQVKCEIDITKLNTKRCKTHASTKGVSSGGVKIGSLDVVLISDEQIESDVDRFAKYYIHYFATMLDDDEDEFNYKYVDNLCNNTDVNRKDVHGQTVMHAIARDWNTDVALFLKSKGVEIDIADNWGRTPLFVAVASGNIEMVRWLIDNGADLTHRTMPGEGQSPIHYAAKYDALEVVIVLLEYGVNPLVQDDQGRTPFFLAAELGIKNTCNFFLDLEIPVVTFDDSGESTIDKIITNLPSDMVNKSLNQFIKQSFTENSQVNLFLSCLGKKRWRLLQKKKDAQLPYYNAPAPLDIIAEKKDFSNIDHPVIIQFIKLKRRIYGNKYFLINNALNLSFTILWSISCSLDIGNIDKPDVISSSDRNIILGVTCAAQVVTFVLIYKLYVEWKIGRDYVQTEKKRKGVQLYNRRPFCHPRWSVELTSLERRVKTIESSSFNFWNSGWTMIEIFCLFLACAYTVITVLWYLKEEEILSSFHYQIRLFFSAFFVLIVWLRLNRCFKYHQTFGPFIAMLEECVLASAQIGFLFLEFYLPFAVAFWVFFGSSEVKDGSDEYMTFNNLLYQLWLLTFIGDYDFDTLTLINSLTAQILVGLFLLVVSLITLNIYIALLSEAFARVSENASQRAYMEEAMIYNNIEKTFPGIKSKFEQYINEFCAPMSIEKKKVLSSGDDCNARSVISSVHEIILEVSNMMEKVVEVEGNARKDVDTLEEKFQVFQANYTENASKQMLRDIKKILVDQNKGVNYMMRKTNNALDKYLTKLKTKYIY